MKIMTFNTQHCLDYVNRKIDPEVMARVIRESGADIVGLNEIYGKGTHPDFIAQAQRLAELTGMKYYYFAPAIELADRGPYGNAFLSNIPIISAEKIMIPDPCPRINKERYETRCVLKARLEGDITVLVAHFGLNSDEQENAVKTVIGHLEDEKCILMGDFNVTPDDPVLSPIRGKMKDTADLFDEPKLSFPSYNPDCKIDYIFVSQDIKVVSADIPVIIASDHRPHVANVIV